MNLLAVSVSRLFESYGGFESIRAALYAEIERIKTISSSLAVSSGTEDIIYELRRSIDTMEEESRRLGLLMQVIDATCRYYKACDGRVTDSLEGSAFQQRFYKTGFVELGAIAQSISDYI